MRFVVEGAGWRLDPEDPAGEFERFERTLDLLDKAIEQGKVFYSSDLFTCEVVDGFIFHDLYGEQGPLIIPHHIRERIAAAFLRLGRWEDEEEWPLDTNVVIGSGDSIYLPSVAWIHRTKSLYPNFHVGVILFSALLSIGSHLVSVAQEDAFEIYFMKQIRDWKYYNRFLIARHTKDSHGLTAFAQEAFPELEFVENCLYGIDKMSRGYNVIIGDVVKHLAAFSDHGERIFSGLGKDVPGHFGALGVDISDENGKTKSDKEARRQRTRRHSGQDMVFWWHSKIEPHRDRIHVSLRINNNKLKVVVGILCFHLK